jgi:hypothetical protein
MSNATTSLTEFLLARIGEDEAQAREAIAERDRINYVRPPEIPDMTLQSFPDVGVPAVLVGPERVLAECEAKRNQISHLIAFMEGDYAPWNEDQLKMMAEVYADHPDFDESWRP